jgi:hypothetical protein
MIHAYIGRQIFDLEFFDFMFIKYVLKTSVHIYLFIGGVIRGKTLEVPYSNFMS